MKRAIVREYFPRDELWKITKECKVLEETEKSIKVKMEWWSSPKWYPKKAIGIRFEVLDASEILNPKETKQEIKDKIPYY